MRFMHCADLHLDAPFLGLSQKDYRLFELLAKASQKAFSKAVTKAIDLEVDAVLIAGDLYDQPKSALGAQLFLQAEFKRLSQAGIPVLLIYGNHDFLESRDDRLDYGENVFTFTTEVETVEIPTRQGESVAVTGFSYASRWIDENIVATYPLRDQNVDYHIGMAHGNLGYQADQDHQYAPFNLSDMKEKGYDYWALGHIHERQIISDDPYIIYPGNPQGQSFKERGPKGVYFVDLEKGQEPVLNFYETNAWQFERLHVDVSRAFGLQQFLDILNDALVKATHQSKHYLIELVLENWEALPVSLLERIENGEFVDEWLENHGYKGNNLDQLAQREKIIYLSDIRLAHISQPRYTLSRQTNENLQASLQPFQDPNLFDETIKELLEHKDWRRAMGQDFDLDAFQADVLERSQNLLMTMTQEERDD